MANVLARIQKSAIKFLLPLTPLETYRVVVDEAMKLVRADSGSIFLDQQGAFQRVYASSGELYNITPRPTGHIYTVFKTRRARILSSEEIENVHPGIKELKFKSIIITPLFNGKESLGALTLQSNKKDFFNEEKLNILKLFSSLATLAIRQTDLYDDLKKALETRDLFISMAAHELRTPLTTITGYIQLLKSKIPDNDSSESRWIKELSWESYRLNQLVSELLEINRIKSGQLDYSWKVCHVTGIIYRAVSLFELTHPHRKLVFENNIDKKRDAVVGDYDKLLQVINNLLDNAVKFSGSDSVITITVDYQTPYLIIGIHDQGKGIDQSEIHKIFETFYRGNHQVEGIGIGLSLVKYILATHHGVVNVRSKLNEGTTMEIKLPTTKI